LVNCRIHGKTQLKIDTVIFKVFCLGCQGLGDKINNLEVLKPLDPDFEETDIECEFHQNAKGKFYCDDCRIFICKVCFANNHRPHNSNLLADTSINFKKNIKKFVETMTKFEPKIDESTKTLADLENRIKEIRFVSTKKLTDLVSNINKISTQKNDNFLKEYKLIFNGTDEDINDVTKRLISLKGTLINIINEITEIRLNFLNKKNNYEACAFKQLYAKTFIDSKKIIKDSKYLIVTKVENSIKAARDKINTFEEEVQKILKKIKVYRSSVINSINTGISSFTLRIRRFTKFSKKGINYFKTTSLKFNAKSPISIVGFSVCGLYSEQYMKNILESKEENGKISDSLEMNRKNFDSLQIKGNNNTNKNTNINNNSTNTNLTSNEKTIPFRFTIKEISNNNDISKFNELINEDFLLKEVKNPIDPTLIYYLNKSINISQDKNYMITILNLSNDVYLDLWSGNVPKYHINSMRQELKCNSSLIKFEFTPPEGIESDFNEFNSGILCDFIFSHKE
jgi:hypothetical protein